MFFILPPGGSPSACFGGRWEVAQIQVGRFRPECGSDPEKGGGKQHISRVLFTATGPGGRAAGVTICLGPPLPAASSGTGGTEREDGQPLFRGPKPWPCSQPGFTEPAPLDAAGALLPHPCTLTCAAGGPRPADRHRRCVSVALSSRSPAPGVTRQAWPSGSPDFPQPAGAPPWPKPRQQSTDRDHLGCFPEFTITGHSLWPDAKAGEAAADDMLASMGL